jgi:uncharacterized protein YcgL (UPF0745 family)
MYLYVSKAEGLSRVPEALRGQFGEPERVMLLNLDGTRKLARVDADHVVEQIRELGYYLQMPPSPEASREELQ